MIKWLNRCKRDNEDIKNVSKEVSNLIDVDIKVTSGKDYNYSKERMIY